jgi:glycosyltransferase involved in cell wall biosynthesis
MGGLDVIVPVHDEEATIGELLARLRRSCPEATLIVVDNASTDATPAVVNTIPGVTLIRHEQNLGYGRSLADGIAAGTGDRIVMIDGDLEYCPEDVVHVDRALRESPAVFASRFLGHGSIDNGRSRWWRAGNGLVTAAFNRLFGQRLTDLYTGLRGVRRTALPESGFHCAGFEFVLELAARLAQAGVRITEVPVRYTPRRVGRSKMRHLREAVRFLYRLVALRFSPSPRRQPVERG